MTLADWWLPFVAGWATAVLWRHRYAVGEWLMEVAELMLTDPPPARPVPPARPCVRLLRPGDDDEPEAA